MNQPANQVVAVALPDPRPRERPKKRSSNPDQWMRNKTKQACLSGILI